MRSVHTASQRITKIGNILSEPLDFVAKQQQQSQHYYRLHIITTLFRDKIEQRETEKK